MPSIAQTGIRGSVEMDASVWAPVAYLSIIPDFTQMYTMSYETIIERADIDEAGSFTFNSAILPEEDHLYRIHFSKVDDPPASLMIGGREENHYFILANRESGITIESGRGLNLINDLKYSGYYLNTALLEIDKIADYLDTLDYGTNVNREFIGQAVKDRLRTYADTCSHPLVSLYALYQSKFESDYAINPDFYKAYLKKWRKEDSEYFKVFRSQLPVSSTGGNIVSLLIMLGIILLPVGLFTYRRYYRTDGNPFKNLTVQERRVFSLLKQGLSNKEISDECGISVSTVKSHVNSIFTKLKVSSRKEVMDFKG